MTVLHFGRHHGLERQEFWKEVIAALFFLAMLLVTLFLPLGALL